MDNPIVSVIIPCFNSSKWIEETLDSVFEQEFESMEVIIIDDGSTDNSEKVIKEYPKPIRYYYQNNKGPSSARNLGIKLAKGKYVAFLDADDLWEKEKIKLQYDFMEKNKNFHLIMSNVKVVKENGEFISINKNNVPTSKSKLINSLFLGEIVMNTPTIFARTSSVKIVGGFDETLPLREDHHFLIKMASQFEICHLKIPLVKRRIISESLSHGVNLEKVYDLNTPFIEKVNNDFYISKRIKKKAYQKLDAMVLKKAWRTRNKTHGIKIIKSKFKYNWLNIRFYVYSFLILFNISPKS